MRQISGQHVDKQVDFCKELTHTLTKRQGHILYIHVIIEKYGDVCFEKHFSALFLKVDYAFQNKKIKSPLKNTL